MKQEYEIKEEIEENMNVKMLRICDILFDTFRIMKNFNKKVNRNNDELMI